MMMGWDSLFIISVIIHKGINNWAVLEYLNATGFKYYVLVVSAARM